MSNQFKACVVKELPFHLKTKASREAVKINPANAIRLSALTTPERLALLTNVYWGSSGVDLSVSFLDNPDQATRKMILDHANAWGQFGNIRFRETNQTGDVRIMRETGQGYWSYLGTDIKQIPYNQPTMNLEAFTSKTPVSEYKRVVRHEFGHTLGFPHEHMRKELIARINPQAAYDWFWRTYQWDKETVDQQVLTPLDPNSMRATQLADQDSIMCYQLPGEITFDGQDIRGGTDIDTLDGQFCGQQYPLIVNPPTPPTNPPTNPGVIYVEIIFALLSSGVKYGVIMDNRKYIKDQIMAGTPEGEIIAEVIRRGKKKKTVKGK